MEYLGLLLEILFLGIGIYLYLLSRGFISSKDAVTQGKINEFKDKNGSWVRIVSLMLVAVSALNLFLHIKALAS